jgi:hypothetical protein
MGSYEWMELQTLTSEIATSRSRLAAARKSRDHGRTRALEEEIAAAEKRRERLLAHITTNLVGSPEGAARAVPVAESGAPDQHAPAVAAPADIAPADIAPADIAPADIAPADIAPAEDTEQPLELVDEIVPSSPEPPAAAPTVDRAEGGITVWDQLTPGDIERARTELVARRAEVLARHAEELKALDADQSQLETLEQAIANFARKFNLPASEGGVVKLDKERELRQQGA